MPFAVAALARTSSAQRFMYFLRPDLSASDVLGPLPKSLRFAKLCKGKGEPLFRAPNVLDLRACRWQMGLH